MGFNRLVPESVKPAHLKGQDCVLVAKVLPMGYCNSVSIAQHIHRNIIKWSSCQMEYPAGAHQEIRKDRAFPLGNDLFRVYLDNFDQIEKVDAGLASLISGQASAQVLAIRQTYQTMGLPRHPKKAVVRAMRAEVQGALVLGDTGIAIAKPMKVWQYVLLGLEALRRGRVTLRELQVICAGFVYICMFRRPLLCSLNGVWTFMEDLKAYPPVVAVELPAQVQLEIARFMALVPLAQMNFRTKIQPHATCSDASSEGGGICVSSGLTSYGLSASRTQVRGEVVEAQEYIQVLSVGLFDGIGALRVACDLLELPMCGHISIEKEEKGRRVVESYFPDTVFHDDVTTVTDELVESWALRFSNAGLILIGAGPPCQGVSKLNADRRGALKDYRSCLFAEVPKKYVTSFGPIFHGRRFTRLWRAWLLCLQKTAK